MASSCGGKGETTHQPANAVHYLKTTGSRPFCCICSSASKSYIILAVCKVYYTTQLHNYIVIIVSHSQDPYGTITLECHKWTKPTLGRDL